ncbi:hypothetical protein F4679DRAFT_395192 [Xylaria curta]|nr:hypothetical protein F4679DRAFT_395192 [Xylaria curta]
MSDLIRTYGRGSSPRSERKRSHEHDDEDERRVRRRSDAHGRSKHRHKRRSRSPSRLGHTDRCEYGPRGDAGNLSHDGKSSHRPTRSQSRSPARHHRRDGHPNSSRHDSTVPNQRHAPKLPYNARSLSRSIDLDAFRPFFARYLDVQKQIDIKRLDEREVRGRWKSFVSKWNNGELAEGWYRPETFEDIMLDTQGARRRESTGARSTSQERRRDHSLGPIRDMHTSQSEDQDGARDRAGADLRSHDTEEGGEDDDDYGPTLPPQGDLGHAMSNSNSLSRTGHGPGIPTLSDLTLRRELEASDRDDARALLRQERKADRTLQKERLDELAPRADPGSQARRLEKRREVRDANASFANAKSSNEMPDLPDADLMGADGGGIEEFKRLRREAERQKTEREVRREEILRAKREEREDRIKEYREREAHTVDMLREIAKSRFG